MRDTIVPPGDDAAIAARVSCLCRPHASGGTVIERSVILAEGSGAVAMLAWIEDHHGVADYTVAGRRSGGLHGARVAAPPAGAPAKRFVLPEGAFE